MGGYAGTVPSDTTGAPHDERSDETERWQVVSRFVEIRSPWLSLIGERLRDREGRDLDHWRVEKPDSLVVVTIQDGRFVLPRRSFRPGVGRSTLDFPGGRIEHTGSLAEDGAAIVRREFGLGAADPFASNEPLNTEGWDVDSSSSSQRLYGMVAELSRAVTIDEPNLGASYPATVAGARELLRDLVCVQCRAVLAAWMERQA